MPVGTFRDPEVEELRMNLNEAITPFLAKEGWPRHQEKWPEGTLFGADGVVRPTSDNRWLEPTTPKV